MKDVGWWVDVVDEGWFRLMKDVGWLVMVDEEWWLKDELVTVVEVVEVLVVAVVVEVQVAVVVLSPVLHLYLVAAVSCSWSLKLLWVRYSFNCVLRQQFLIPRKQAVVSIYLYKNTAFLYTEAVA